MVVPTNQSTGQPQPGAMPYSPFIAASDVSCTHTRSDKSDAEPTTHARVFNFMSFRSFLSRTHHDDEDEQRQNSPVTISASSADKQAFQVDVADIRSLHSSDRDDDCGTAGLTPSYDPDDARRDTQSTAHSGGAPHTAARGGMLESRDPSAYMAPCTAPRMLQVHGMSVEIVPDAASPAACAYIVGEYPRRLGLSEAQYRLLLDRQQRLADVTTLVTRYQRTASLQSMDDLTAQRREASHAAGASADSNRVGQGSCPKSRVASPPPPVSLSVDIDADESVTRSPLGSSSPRRLRSGGADRAARCTDTTSTHLGNARAAQAVAVAPSCLSDPYAHFLFFCAMVAQRVALLETLADGLAEDLAEAQQRCATALRYKRTQRSDKADRERLRAVHVLLCLWRNRANNKVATAAVYTEAVECMDALPLVMPLAAREVSTASGARRSSSAVSSGRRRRAAPRAVVEDVIHAPWVTADEAAARAVFLQDAASLSAAQEQHIRTLAADITAAYEHQARTSEAIEFFLVHVSEKLFQGQAHSSQTRSSQTRKKTASPVSWRRRLLEESGDEVVAELLLAQLLFFNDRTATLGGAGASATVIRTPDADVLSLPAATNPAVSFVPVSPLQLLSSPLPPAIKSVSAYTSNDRQNQGSVGTPLSRSASARTARPKRVSFLLEETPTMTRRTSAPTAFCVRAPGHVEQLMTWMASQRAAVMHSISDDAMRLAHVEQVNYFKLIQLGGGGFSRPATMTAHTPGRTSYSAFSARSLDRSTLVCPSTRPRTSPSSARSASADSRRDAVHDTETGSRLSRKENVSCGNPSKCVMM